jgi:outer membrane cobalamin receptor
MSPLMRGTHLEIRSIRTSALRHENFKNSIGALEASGKVTQNWTTLFRVGRMQDDLRQTAVDPYAATPSPDYETTNRTTLDWQNSIQAGEHAITAGGIWMDESTRALVYGTQFDVNTRSTTGYAEDRVSFGRHHSQHSARRITALSAITEPTTSTMDSSRR